MNELRPDRMRGAALERLAVLARENRLPQSVLLVGPEGSGKEASALELAVELLRPNGGGSAAGGLFGDLPVDDSDRDTAARKVRQLAHPDLYVVFPVERTLTADQYRELLDEKGRWPLARVRQPSSAIIPIGDAGDSAPVSVRAIRRFANARPFEADHRVVVVGDAHRMNRAAANALLKTLEEPPDAAVLLLCSHQPHLLPATIRSRCARVQVPGLSEADLAAILEREADVDPTEAARVAAVAGGNARRAFDLIDPAARELAGWADQVLDMLLRGDRPSLARAGERVAKAQPPGERGGKLAGDAGLSLARDVAMRVVDLVAADLAALGRRETGARLDDARRTSLPDTRVDGVRAMRAVEVLLDARFDLARNVNVGLVLVDSFLRTEAALHGALVASA